MKWYEVQRVYGVVRCKVIEGDGSYPLRHLVKHSPDGFEFGYGGSGPSDLARSIIGDFLDDPQPDNRVYQKFKWDVVGTWKGDGPHRVPASAIESWMENEFPEVKGMLS